MDPENVTHLLYRKRSEREVLIAVHRGCHGGNIIENTIPAFEIALKYGGDIIEADVAQSTDGRLYTIHEGQEERLFFSKKNIQTCSSEEIAHLSYRNSSSNKVGQKVEVLEDVLKHFKGDALINLDRAWNVWSDVVELLDKYSMFDQVILKSPVQKNYLDELERLNVPVMYMPIVKRRSELAEVLNRPINTVGAELIMENKESDLNSDPLIQELKERHLLVWLNTIRLDDAETLTLGYDDDRSLLESEEDGWGKILSLKPDIIQTDWPLHLSYYLKKRSKRKNELIL
ncbi:glycerophosphodiester phosphodiesterase family protein [Sporolactobacillus sp. THM7-7]|nr:glycerophosphodiester phosphodiesterase family protein [Sporolactobacillus sp. THM7-7]